jgi:hypothetical protein
MNKKTIIFSVCSLFALLIFFAAFFRPKPDGGFYWTFITYAPVIVGGDGLSYDTAYKVKKGQAGYLATLECGLIHDKYHVDDDVMVFTNASVNGRIYDVISFPVFSGTNTVYFDVTEYRQKK